MMAMYMHIYRGGVVSCGLYVYMSDDSYSESNAICLLFANTD